MPTAVVPNITGTVGSLATFDGAGSVAPDFYRWTLVSKPGGSLANAVIPFPDNAASAPIDMTDNLALYHFETIGATTPDDSGRSINLTVTGVTQTTGKVGTYAASFSKATGDYLEYTSSDVLPGTTNEISISFWQYGVNPSGNNSLIRAVDALGNRAINIHLTYNNTIYWECGNNGTASYDSISKYIGQGSAGINPWAVGTWVHFVFTKNATTGNMRIYVNGNLWESGSSKTKTLPAITNLKIGYQTDSQVQYYNGYLDELAIWKKELSATEVADIYEAQEGANLIWLGTTFPFTPDTAGTYQVNLEVATGISTTALATISSAPTGGGPTSQGEAVQGFASQPSKLQGDI